MRFLAVLLLAGCASSSRGLNLESVTPQAVRMAQPVTDADWDAVAALDVGGIIKFNCAQEGDEGGARKRGIPVYPLCLHPRTDQGWLGWIEVFRGPNDDELVAMDWLARAVASHPGPWRIAWHCTHGCDRTGMFSAMVGRYYYGWTREQAYRYLLTGGGGCWHKLPGLHRAWDRWNRNVYGRSP